MSGSPADCKEWAIVTDELSCADLASEAGISLEQFLAWNPAVSSDCKTNYWVDEAYCIGISGDDDEGSATTASTTTSPTTSKHTPPGPTMTGSPADCNKWSLVTDGLSCTDLATQAGISLAQFLAWNPAVLPRMQVQWASQAHRDATNPHKDDDQATIFLHTTKVYVSLLCKSYIQQFPTTRMCNNREIQPFAVPLCRRYRNSVSSKLRSHFH